MARASGSLVPQVSVSGVVEVASSHLRATTDEARLGTYHNLIGAWLRNGYLLQHNVTDTTSLGDAPHLHTRSCSN